MNSRNFLRFTIAIVQMLLFTNISISANLWKSGYFISNSGDTTHCLIKYEDWKNNPTQFKWKKSYDADTRIASIEFVSAFRIDSISMYIRDTIQFETSSAKIDDLSNSREPQFESRIVFLRVLVLGSASLYYYEKDNAQRYFFSHPEQPVPEALIYKMYKSDDDQVRQNFKFREQIWKSIDCKEITLKSINDLEYDRKQLVQLFISINKCRGSDFTNFDQFRTKGTFNLNAFLSAYNMHSKLSNAYYQFEAGYLTKPTWQVGIELEYLLPFWNNTWSLSLAPSLLKYSTEGTYIINNIPTSSSFNFLSLDINFIVRKYFDLFLNETFFVNGGIVMAFPLQSEFIAFREKTEIRSSRNFIIGAGYEIWDRLSAELRYGFDRDYVWGTTWKVDSYYYGLVMSVRLF